MDYTWHDEAVTPPETGVWPEKIFVELTSRCNMACRFCPSPVLGRSRQDIDPELMKKILGEIKGKNVLLTFHVMGEPLLNKNFFEYARLCDEYDIKYWLVSNGMLFTEAKIEKIFSLKNLQNLEVSFHTFDKEAWKLRGAPLSFEAYLDRIRLAVFSPRRYERGIPLNIDIMYDTHLGCAGWGAFSKKSWQEFAHTLLAWRKELVNKFPDAEERYAKFFHGKKKKFQRGNLIWWRDLEEMPENLFEDLPPYQMWLAWEMFPVIFVTFKKFFFFGKDDKYLRHAFASDNPLRVKPANGFQCAWNRDMAILADGTITFCCLDYEGQLGCGNIRDMSIGDACISWQRQRLLQKPDDFSFCRSCKGQIIYPQ